MGYFKTGTRLPAINPVVSVEHQLIAPFGDHPLIIDIVTLDNLIDEDISFRHFEYFDVNRIQVKEKKKPKIIFVCF